MYGGNYWDNQCGFRRNRSTTGHTLCIRQILEKKMGIQSSSVSGQMKRQLDATL
jgi:hypothetical protein